MHNYICISRESLLNNCRQPNNDAILNQFLALGDFSIEVENNFTPHSKGITLSMLTGKQKSKDATISAGQRVEENPQIEIMLGVPEGQRNKVSTEIISAGRVNSIGDVFAIISQFNLYCITLIKALRPDDVTQPRCVLYYIFTSVFDLLNNNRV